MTLSIQPPMQVSIPSTGKTPKTFSLTMQPEALNRPALTLQATIVPNFFNDSKPAKPNEIFTIQLETSKFTKDETTNLFQTFIQVPTQPPNSPKKLSGYAITFHVKDPGAESNISSGYTVYNWDLGQFEAHLLARESELTWRIIAIK